MVSREIVFKNYDTPGLELFEVVVAPTSSGKHVILANFEELPEEMSAYQAEVAAVLLMAASDEAVPF